jgi:hypothetical protein
LNQILFALSREFLDDKFVKVRKKRSLILLERSEIIY